MPRATLQRDILEAAFDCLRPGGVFVQFTYGPQAPVADSVALELGLQVRRGDFVLRNMPPATVYVYAALTGDRLGCNRQASCTGLLLILGRMIAPPSLAFHPVPTILGSSAIAGAPHRRSR